MSSASSVVPSISTRASQQDKNLWAALRSQTSGAPSPYSLAEWSDAIPRMREAETEEIARAHREPKDAVDSRLYDEEAQWVARVAKLETSSLNSQKNPGERLRLALALIAKKADFDRAGSSEFEAAMAQRAWRSAEHFNAWNNRDHGPIHTAKRMRFFADLLRVFAGGCLRAWQLGNEPAGSAQKQASAVALHDAHIQECWLQATALALRAAGSVLSAETMGVNPTTAGQGGKARAQSVWAGRIGAENSTPLHEVFLRAWSESQNAFGRTVKSLGGDALALPVVVAAALANTAAVCAAEQEPQGDCQSVSAAPAKSIANPSVVAAKKRAQEGKKALRP